VPIAEIAQIPGFAIGTIKSRLFRRRALSRGRWQAGMGARK
jgi:DNA-directed RNA polymerase specialized sigma24 family protein